MNINQFYPEMHTKAKFRQNGLHLNFLLVLIFGEGLHEFYLHLTKVILPPYILAGSSGNESKASKNFSFIQKLNACQNSSSNFISKRSRSPNKGTLDSKSHIFG